ncbi:MAG: hypothetical protein N2491_13205 [Negativicutes bacterium]|nr:hypothetical protein [Negativicutes bacterium]
MEELLKQLVEGQKQLFEGQKQLSEGQKQLFEGQKQLFEGQKQIETRLDKIEARLDNLESQVKENSQFIQALLHRTEELDAKFDGLLHTMVTKETLSTLATKEEINAQFEVLNSRLFKNEVEVQRLKAIK